MKYLKKYESLDSSKRERNLRFLGDMSFELGDNGFNVEVISYDDFGLGDIIVRINKKSKPSPLGMYGSLRFNYNDIKETLLSMISYMESELYSIGSIEVSDKYVHNLIPVKLKGEELYLEYRPEQRVDYSIGQLVIKFK
jgi:hypothetical protein